MVTSGTMSRSCRMPPPISRSPTSSARFSGAGEEAGRTRTSAPYGPGVTLFRPKREQRPTARRAPRSGLRSVTLAAGGCGSQLTSAARARARVGVLLALLIELFAPCLVAAERCVGAAWSERARSARGALSLPLAMPSLAVLARLLVVTEVPAIRRRRAARVQHARLFLSLVVSHEPMIRVGRAMSHTLCRVRHLDCVLLRAQTRRLNLSGRETIRPTATTGGR